MSSSLVLKTDALNVLRCIARELRYANPKSSPRNLLGFQYLMKQYRENQLTQEQVCRSHNSLLHNAQTYLCLLRSTRECEALRAEYTHEERTVQESARLVGLELPKTPPLGE
ncbi:protein FMC1 homolog [Strongylocentrotus purpuratus]|uniref:Protein FMC1 homolog n=1 Tax=Strongylocentrotus purpuratus TaxID=7668 RepID=A0A7M7T5W2_STRPU|nr:protein FMC1 homolog [Strongylocentrotus purpuratus]